jgi:hypothetical protein
MHSAKPWLLLACSGVLAAACLGGERPPGDGGIDDGGPPGGQPADGQPGDGGIAGGEWVEATLLPSLPPMLACQGQRAAVPRSGRVSRSFTRNNSTSARSTQSPSVYVAYQLQDTEVFAYFSFDPALPARFSTEQARALLKYAYVGFQLQQPPDLGGRLTLLLTGVLLDVTDFERFEVQDGELRWRLVRPSEGYHKVLTIYDEDPSNDPVPRLREDCRTDDIIGVCHCPFSGPTVTVEIEGAIPQ